METPQIYWSLSQAWKFCPRKFLLWIGINLIHIFISPVYLLVSSHLIDRLSARNTTPNSCLFPLVAIIFFLFLKGIYRMLTVTIRQLLTQDIQTGVAQDLMVQNAKIPVQAFDDDDFVKMLYLCSNSHNAANVAVLAQGVITVLGQLTSIITLLLLAAQIAWLFVFVVLILTVVSTVICMRIATIRYRVEKDCIVDNRWKSYYFQCTNSLETAREVRTLKLGNFFIDKWHSIADKLRIQLLQIEHSKNLGNKGIEAINTLTSCIMLLCGILLLDNNTITLGTMYLIWQLSSELQTTIRSFCSELLEPYAAIPKVKDTQEYLSMHFENIKPVSDQPEHPLPQRVNGDGIYSANNITFAYEDKKNVLENLSITINKGELVALCGMNGCGKSTFTNLLTGLYAPAKGELRFCDIPYPKLSAVSLCRHAGVAFQRPCFYGFTLREEIALGQIDLLDDMESIVDAVQRGGAQKTADKYGWDTYVGTAFEITGTHLSGGEQQRIGVSRALLGRKPILLLDEPAAALDPLAEYQQFREIKEQIQGETAILISHRIGFARLADRILVMDKGKIVEDGTHEELMSHQGLYFRMFEAQRSWYDDLTEVYDT